MNNFFYNHIYEHIVLAANISEKDVDNIIQTIQTVIGGDKAQAIKTIYKSASPEQLVRLKQMLDADTEITEEKTPGSEDEFIFQHDYRGSYQYSPQEEPVSTSLYGIFAIPVGNY